MKLDKRYTRDDTVGMELEDSPWKAIATTSALIAGGVLAYKSGLLKKGVSQLIEAAGHSSGKTMDNIVAMKNWANSKDLSEQFSKSLIRNSGLISFDTMFTKKGIQEISSFGKKLLDPASRADVIRATTDDLSYISKQLKDRATTEAMRKKGIVLNKIDDTQLFRLNNRINDNIEEITRDVSDKAGKSASRQSTEDLMKKMIITDEATKKQLKKSGHRAMTINDLGEYGRNDLGTYFSPSEHGMNFSDTLMNSIRELGEKEFTDADGNIKKLIDSNEFGKMSIDPALLINEKGKIADLRNLKNGFQDGVEMMATQFQVPVIGLNPLRLFGLDGIKDTIDDFGVFSAGTRQSAFKASTEIISKPYLLSGGGVFDIAEDGVMTKIKSNVSATRLFRDNRFNSRQTEALIKIHGIPKNVIKEFGPEDGPINNARGALGRLFDFGRSDVRNQSHRDLGIGDFLNPNNYIEKFTNGLFKGFKGAKEGSALRDGLLRTYKSSAPRYANNFQHLAPEVGNTIKSSADKIDNAMARLLDAEESPILIAMNNSIKLTDAVLGRNDATVGKFLGQFVAGRNNLGDVTSTTLSSFHVVERVNATLNIAGIGLSTRSMSNSPAILKNLILKRALPVVGAYNAFEYVNHMTEDEETGDNITKKAARGIVNTKLTVAKFRDFTGITDVAKKISEYTPGSDQLTELPGINTLDLDKSEEELKDYYENGYDPIRKGRYWDSGIQAFTGSKINYYRPNWYRRTMADVKFSDSQYGSREEYFDNAAFPTPGHLFAPVRHFITDRYHWDKKHYQDRPYPITAPAFSNVPVVGPLLGSTIGQVIKPQKRMHEDELMGDPSVMSNGSVVSGSMGMSNGDLSVAGGIASSGSQKSFMKYGNARPALYSTSGGKVSVVGLNDTVSVPEARAVLENRGIGAVIGATQRLDMNTGNADAETEDYTNASNVITATGSTYNNMTDFLGIYGYAARTVFGKANQDNLYIENSSYATSMGRTFWDQEIGGLGGDLSEIFRRFIPKRGQNDEYYNPIRNTMPGWMPSDNYFIDFQTGDPYCVSPETLIETKDSILVEAKDVKKGMSIKTHKGNWMPVEDIAVRCIKEKEDVYEIITATNSAFPMVISEEHPILVLDNKEKGKPSVFSKDLLGWVKAEEVKVGDYVAYPIEKSADQVTPRISYSDYYQDLHVVMDDKLYYRANTSPMQIEIMSWMNKFGIPSLKRGERKKLLREKGWDVLSYESASRSIQKDQWSTYTISDVVELSDDILFFFGLWFAEGSASLNGEITLITHKKEESFRKIIDRAMISLIGKPFVEYPHNGSRTSVRSTISHKPLSHLLIGLFGSGAKEKNIPFGITNLPDSLLASFINGYFLGDGCVFSTKKRLRVSLKSVSRNAVYQLKTILLSKGIVGAISKGKSRTSKTREGIDIVSGEYYCLNFNGEQAINFIEYTGYSKNDIGDFQVSKSTSYHIDGDYLYTRINKITKVRDVPYVIGFEVGIDDSFCVAGVATHNTKVKAGEERLPGEGYERLNGIDVFDMRIGSSSIGKTKEEIISHYLNEDPILSDTMAEDVTAEGTAIHKKIEKEWLDSGYAIETEGQIEDKANNIVGFYDARVVDESAPGGQAIKDIKTVSDNVFKQVKRDGIREDHKRQVNYYLWSLNLQRGGIYYVNRDTGETLDLAFDFDKKAFNSTMKNVYDAREFIMNGIQDGTVARGDLYDPVDRMRILGDVAPYSEEYKQMASIVSRSRLSKEEEEEVKQIRDRVSAQKKPLRTYDYKFKTADLVKEKVEVQRMYDYNTIYLNGYEAPMRFAGLDVRVGDTEKEKKEIAEYMNDLFDSGSDLTIGVDKASNAQTKSGSIRAVVYKNGRNINKEMIDRGYAKVNEEDDSAAAINGRYNAVERFVGSVWETFAHADSPLHCIAPWTQIVTKHGAVKAKDLKTGTEVLTHEGNFKRVVDVRPQSSGKKIVDVKISSSNILLTATEDHPILACKQIRKKRITSHATGLKLEPYGVNPKVEFILAGELKPYDYVVYKPRKMYDVPQQSIDVFSLSNRFVKHKDRIHTKTSSGSANLFRHSTEEHIKVTGDLARLFGYYAAEGCTSESRGVLNYTIFTFNSEEKEYIEDVVRIVKKIFRVKARVIVCGNTTHVKVGSSFVAEIVSRYVGHKTEKHVPDELFNNKLRAEFIRGLMRGDGTKAGYCRYDTIGMASLNILLWLRDAMFNLWNIPVSVALSVERENNLYVLRIGKYHQLAEFIDTEKEFVDERFVQNVQTRTRVSVDGYIFYRVEEVNRSAYQGSTIDIEVEDDDTFTTLNASVHNTKFLQVRSPLESYERERVYGKQFTEWTDPVQDFIKPLVIDRNVNRGFLSGIIWGGVIGAMFGTRKAGRMVSAIVGATAVTAGKVGKAYYEATNNERWKPERVRKDNEINEYMDMLKYIKSKKLYNDYADKAMAEDGINVRSFIGSKQSQGRGRKNEKYELQNIKQNVKSMGTLWGSIASIIQGDTETLVNPFGNEKEELRKINQKIEERASHRELLTGFTRNSKNIDWRTIDRIKALQTLQTYVGNSNDDDNDLATQISTNKPKYVSLADIGDLKRNRAKMISGIDREIGELAEESNITHNVVKAIQYYNESEQTMYGYEKGDPITNLLAAMPKRDRDYFNLFVDAPEEDRLKILELAPKYMRRSLEASWKIDPEAKPSLEAYFGQRALPDANWAGWNENVNLNVVRVKMLKKADLDFSDVNVWKDDIKQANAAGEIPIPRLDVRTNANRIKNDLYDILGKTGIRDLQIEMQYSNTDSNVDLDLKYDTRKKIEQQLQEYENDLVG